MKNFARKWVLPPGINQLLADAPPSLKRLWGGRSSRLESGPGHDYFGRQEVDALTLLNPEGESAASLEELRVAPYGHLLWVETSKVRVWGRAFTWQQNQHVRYFKDGFESFRRFYELHQPKNQFEALMIDSSSVGEFTPVPFPRVRTPWAFETRYISEGHLDYSHGTQEHGPITQEKLVTEQKRLDAIRYSIEQQGFWKQNRDFIRFKELLIDDSQPGPTDYRVRVSGVHRTSFLAHMGWPMIPMMPEPALPWREVRLSDSSVWPGVLDGTFSQAAAVVFFMGYFRDQNEELLPGW